MVIIALILILLLNAFFVLQQIKQTESERMCSGSILADIYAEYAENSTQLDNYYVELKEYQKSQQEVRKAAKKAGLDFIETRQSIWTEGLYTDDIDILDELYAFVADRDNFLHEVTVYVGNTETNINEFLKNGFSENSYECRNQRKAGELYTDVGENVILHTVYITGWNDFYSCSVTGTLVLIFVIVVSSVAFIYEKECGMLTVVKTARRGRRTCGCSKLIACGVISVLAALILTVETFVLISVSEGFNGGDEAIQSLDAFRKSTLIISISGYMPIYICQRMLASLVVSGITSLVSVIFYNYVISFALSAAFVGANFAMFASGSDLLQYPARYINIFSLAEGTRLFSRYAALNILQFPETYGTCLVFMLPLVIAALSAGALLLFCRRGAGVELSFPKKLKKRTFAEGKQKKQKLRRTCHASGHLSLLRHELFKMTAASPLALVASVLLIVGIIVYSKSAAFTREYSYTEKLYARYLSEYSGIWTEEKHLQIRELKDNNENIISGYSTITEKLQQGIITSEEYTEYCNDYVVAVREKAAIAKLYEHSLYLKKENTDTGVTGYFLDSRGWEAYLTADPDYFLYAAILILTAACFSLEYGHKSASCILHTCARGRNYLFFCKLRSVILLAVITRLLCDLPSLIIAWIKLGLPFPSAPVLSAEALTAVKSDITFAGLAVIIMAIRLLSACLLGVLVMSMSCLTRKALGAIAISASLTLLPSLAAYSGITALSKLDFMSMFDAGSLVLVSASVSEGGKFGFAVVFIFAAAIVCSVLTVFSHRRFCRKP